MTAGLFRQFQTTRDNLSVLLESLAHVSEARSAEGIDTGSVLSDNGEAIYQRPLASLLRERAELVRRKRAFRLAVVGEFSSGKSTLINALLGRNLLSTSNRPTTAVVTVLRFGTAERLRITYHNVSPGQPQSIEYHAATPEDLATALARYTSDANEGIEGQIQIMEGQRTSLAESIKEVEVWCNASFLRDQEIEIIDTPGLGSVFSAHKQVTESIIPDVDATILLFDADKGVGDDEIAFLKYMRQYVNQMLFVLSKADKADDEEELKGKLRLAQDTIAYKVPIINVQEVYPISARAQIQGDSERSGFLQFVDVLQDFLVRSSGTVRLQIPLQVARSYWAQLKGGVDQDLEAVEHSLDQIRQARENLERQRERIQERKANLLRYISDSVADMYLDACQGIDMLPTQLQMVIERQIDSYGVNKLSQADKHIRAALKEEVDKWFATKSERFGAKATLLAQRIDEDLRGMLDSIHQSVRLSSRQRSIDVVTPQIRHVFTRGLANFAGATMKKSAVTLGVSLTLTGVVAGMFAVPVAAIAPPIIVLVPFLIAARTMLMEGTRLPDRVRTDIKEQLRRPMQNNTVNAYQAIVNGYTNESGAHQPGVSRIVENSFSDWVKELKTQIEGTISLNLDSYQRDLDRRITNEESGRWSRDEERHSLIAQNEELVRCEQLLIALETVIERLTSNG